MHEFEFNSVTRILFGRGSCERIGELAGELGRTAMVIANGGEPGDGGVVDRIGRRLSSSGVRMVFLRQRGEPQVTDVDRGVRRARRESCDLLIGLGGGSAIDAAKAVAGVLANGGSALDYMEVIGEGRKITRRALPWIAVPATAGTGAEVTRNAVIACREKQFKASIRGWQLLASVALVDPELGAGVCPEVTARSGMDAMSQLIESATSNKAQPITDALAIKGISLAARALPRVFHDGNDSEARENMAMAALLSGITLTNAGLGAVHGFAAPLGASFPVPHGAVCAVLLPYVMAANVAALQAESPDHSALKRYAEIGRALVVEAGMGDRAAIEAGVGRVRELVRELSIPPLSEFGVGAVDVPRLVSLARKSSSMRYNPVVLSDEALTEILAKTL